MSSIGAWAARFDGDRQVTRWHYVESEIEDRLITYCGRQMHRRNRKGHLLVQETPSADRCLDCPEEAE